MSLRIILAILCILVSCQASFSSRNIVQANNICQQISSNVSGDVYYPVDLRPNYLSGVQHYMTSSSQKAMCVVEVENEEDISIVLKLVGKTQTLFAVKSGGHASNQGFSSTTGVLISLGRLKQVILSEDKKTVEVGFGNVWTDVYNALDGSGVNVVGGRVPGPGTGGFTLGGGYSWLTNQYGLTSDTVLSYTLILPNGTISSINAVTSPDLFFALKGGLNRFGVVSKAIFKTVSQPNKVYGGLQIFSPTQVPALLNATEAFQTHNTDPKAQVILTLNTGLSPGPILLSFYDGLERPSAFKPYDKIIPLVSGLQPSSYAQFARNTPSAFSAGSRGAFASLSTTTFTMGFLQAVQNESTYYSQAASLHHPGALISYDIEPFMDYGIHAVDSAYPHKHSQLPLNLYFSWKLESEDEYWKGAMRQSVEYLKGFARKEGIYGDGDDEKVTTYPNYSLSDVSSEELYGKRNAERLRGIQRRVDPDGVMALTGGFSL